ncbi:MAG: hypothetical protein A2Y80_03485, partial [Deltaproteobacteria bacterium RBG_13_58_19]
HCQAADNKRILTMATWVSKEGRAPYVLALIFVILAAGIITAGYFYYRHYEEHYRVEVERKLSAIADLKVDDITRWRRERLADASVLYQNITFAALVRRYFDQPQDLDLQQELLAWISQIQGNYDYESVILLDARGRVRLSVPDTGMPLCSLVQEKAGGILGSGQVTFLDFHRDEASRGIHLGIFVPIPSGAASGPPLGALVLKIDPETYLYPFLQRWPTPSQTAETLIVRREGNEVVFLNDLRFKPNTALTFRIPLDSKDTPVVQAALGQEGIVQGIDYRGVPVMAAVRAVPGSPWFLVARMDATEVNAPLREKLWLMVVLVGALLIGAGASVGWVWRYQSARFHRERYEAAEALGRQQEKTKQYLNLVGTIIIALQADGTVNLVNQPGCSLLGYPEEEIVGKNWFDHFLPERERAEVEKVFKQLMAGIIDPVEYFENVIVTRSGEEHTIAWHNTVIRDEAGTITGTLSSGEDITERRQAEAAFKSLIFSAPIGIFIVQEGKFKLVNNAFINEVGFSGDELLEHDAFFLITPEFQPVVREKVIHMLKGQLSDAFEFQIINKKGELRWVLERVTSIYYSGERAILGYFMDITQRKQTEKTLEEIQSRQKAILDNIPDIAWLKDQESRYIAANEPFAQAIGFSREDLVGRTDLEFWPQELAEKYRQDDQEVMQEGQRKTWEEPLVDKDGKMVWIETIKTPIYNDQGEVIGTTGIARDITTRKKIEDDLRRAHREIEQLFDSIPSIIIGLSMTGVVHAWNAAAERLLELPVPAVLGQELQKFSINWEWDRIAEGLAQCKEKGETVRVEKVRFQRPDGKEGFLGISINPIKAEEGWLSGLILLGADITERKILEGQLAQAQKLESIGQLAAGIAHEINTPIQYVGDNTRFLQESFRELFQLIEDYRGLLAGETTGEGNGDLQQRVEDLLAQADIDYLEEEIPKAIQQTLEGVERVARIVRAMKDFSHPGRAEKTLNDINKAIDSTITVTRNEWKYVADMVTDLDPSLPLVPLLPNEFNQVILNIIINAAHAIAEAVDQGKGEKGAITISTRRLGDEVEVRLQDTGPGIPPEIKERIFDPFFTTKEVGKGTGQGLAIAHDVIVEKHGGAITFETEMGRGTTFVIRLPLGQQPEFKGKPDEDSHSLCR